MSQVPARFSKENLPHDHHEQGCVHFLRVTESAPVTISPLTISPTKRRQQVSLDLHKRQSPLLAFPHQTQDFSSPLYNADRCCLLFRFPSLYSLSHTHTKKRKTKPEIAEYTVARGVIVRAMGFPVGYTELLFPKLVLHLLSVFGFIRKLIYALFRYLGLHDFLEPDIAWPNASTRIPEFESVSALLIREILPVVKFRELVDPPDSCAVCLSEFEENDEIRRLANCRHIFHRGCLDRWMGYDQRTCPLCRTPFIPDDMQGAFNERLWAASGIPEFPSDVAAL